MGTRDKLVEIVGSENFSDDPEALDTYSKDFSLTPSGVPNCAVKPKTAEEVQKVIKFANEHLLPVVPVSSWVHFHGATIPKQGGIILDLTRMNRILEVDEPNRRVRMEVGVTWEQITSHLAKKGFRIMMPLLPHPLRSAVTDHLEREVITNTVYDYGEPLQSMEVVWPTGEIFRTGSASVAGYPDSPSKGANPSGPGIDFYRFLQGAQGTMGVITWANLKTEYLTKMDKIFLAPVNDLSRIMEFLYRVLRLRIGQECLLLNNINLAAIMAEDLPKDFDKLRASLPPWTLILVISGHQRRPEGKIQYEEEALNKVIKNEFPKISLADSLPGLPGSGKKLLPMLREPWPKEVTYWKNRYKGGCHSLFFITKPALAPKFINKVEEIAAKHGYPVSDIGGYIQPIEHNRACYLEFDFFYDPTSHPEVERVRKLYTEAAPVLLKEGALFTRPYGELAKLVYDRANGYTATLKRVKKLFDPNNIMNPGNLCF
ncbi:MAG: FAD-binding oxidoreductase [Dehalococcoidales bacterium]|nr:FAD-binding oxidoreductase [Dehalococcoidales bacterium]